MRNRDRPARDRNIDSNIPGAGRRAARIADAPELQSAGKRRIDADEITFRRGGIIIIDSLWRVEASEDSLDF